jgi:hypothetical protein
MTRELIEVVGVYTDADEEPVLRFAPAHPERSAAELAAAARAAYPPNSALRSQRRRDV